MDKIQRYAQQFHDYGVVKSEYGEYVKYEDYQKLAAAHQALQAMFAKFQPYLKEGETPIERLERERKDCDAVMSLLITERTKTEELTGLMNAKNLGNDVVQNGGIERSV